jgi:hypothetical protein
MEAALDKDAERVADVLGELSEGSKTVSFYSHEQKDLISQVH